MNISISNRWAITPLTGALFVFTLFFLQSLLSTTVFPGIAFNVKPDSAFSYAYMGYNQFTTSGLGHLFFLVAIFLISPKASTMLVQVGVFTIALMLSMVVTFTRLIETSEYVVRAFIYFSILAIVIENLSVKKLKLISARFYLVFLIGLVHGASLAHTFTDMLAPEKVRIFSASLYTIGLIAGEISVVGVLVISITTFFADKEYYQKKVLVPISILLGLFAVYGIIQELMITN